MTRRRSTPTAALGIAVALAGVLTACGGGGKGAGGDAVDAAAAGSAETIPIVTGTGRDADVVEFVTTPPTTTTTTLPPPTTTTTTTSTTTSSTTTTSTTTTSTTTTTTTVPPPTIVRCSFAADALFEPGEATLTDAAVGELTVLAGELVGEVRSVRVEGRTDHRGSDDENLTLSEGRADAAARALVDAGVDRALITSVGLGEVDAHQPAAGSTPTDSQMAGDRRVDILIDADVATSCPTA